MMTGKSRRNNVLWDTANTHSSSSYAGDVVLGRERSAALVRPQICRVFLEAASNFRRSMLLRNPRLNRERHEARSVSRRPPSLQQNRTYVKGAVVLENPTSPTQ